MCGDSPLKEVFPNLYSLTEKGVKAADVWDTSTGEGGWNPTFFRPLNDWEMGDDQRFMSFLCSKKSVENDLLCQIGDIVRPNMTLLEGSASSAVPHKLI